MFTAKNLSVTMSVLGFLAGASTQLTDIFAPFGSAAPLIVKEIVSLSGFGVGILGILVASMTGQSSMVRTVQDMPGIEKMLVNEKASPTLAALAVDPAQLKIEATPGAAAAVAETAKGA